MIMYMLLSYIFMIVFDCNNLPEHKTSSLILSESLSIVSCNILVYLIAIMPAAATGFLPIEPIIYMTLVDIAIIIIWSIFTAKIFKKLNPPSNLLLISNNETIDELSYKILKREDLFKINEKISVSDNDVDKIYKTIDKYVDILIGDITSEYRNDIIKYSFSNSKNIYVVPKLSDILIKYSDEMFILDTPIYLSTNFGLSLEALIVKRLLDIVFSVVVLIVFLPIWIMIALIIKLEDGGPVFYLQERITLDLKPFKIIKFRSMKVSSSDEVIPTGVEDDRITKIGKFIRKFHIDEVPQFINVLLGDMSVVGPRPERIEHVNLYSKEISEFQYRYKVKAGITGLAQIYGKYNTSAIDKLKLDLIYIKKYSLVFDLELIFRTIKAIFSKENTEGFDKEKIEFIKQNAK